MGGLSLAPRKRSGRLQAMRCATSGSRPTSSWSRSRATSEAARAALPRLADDQDRRRGRGLARARASRSRSPAGSTGCATGASRRCPTPRTCATRDEEGGAAMSLAIGDDAPALRPPRHGGRRARLRRRRAHAWSCSPATTAPTRSPGTSGCSQVARDYDGLALPRGQPNDAERYPRDSFDAMRERVEADGGWPHPYLRDESQEVARRLRSAGPRRTCSCSTPRGRCATAARRTPTTG